MDKFCELCDAGPRGLNFCNTDIRAESSIKGECLVSSICGISIETKEGSIIIRYSREEIGREDTKGLIQAVREGRDALEDYLIGNKDGNPLLCALSVGKR